MSRILKQRHGLFDRRTYEIKEKELIVTHEGLSSGTQHSFEIFDLSETTVREFKREWAWFIAGILCFLPSLKFVFDAIKLGALFPIYPAVTFWVISAILLIMFFDRSYDKLIFTNWKTGEGMFVIWNNKPNKVEFNRFMEELVREIKETKINPKLSPEQKLDIYADSLSFLVNEEVISSEEAEAILQRKEKEMKQSKSNILKIVSD